MRRIGIDMGGVITDTFDQRQRGVEFLDSTPKERSFEVIHGLVKRYGAGNVIVLSRACDETRRQANIDWLERHRFCETTGVLAEDIHVFVGPRDEKGRIATRLGITHMIDDRLEVLSSFDAQVVSIAFAAEDNEYLPRFEGRTLLHAANWSDVGRLLH